MRAGEVAAVHLVVTCGLHEFPSEAGIVLLGLHTFYSLDLLQGMGVNTLRLVDFDRTQGNHYFHHSVLTTSLVIAATPNPLKALLHHALATRYIRDCVPAIGHKLYDEEKKRQTCILQLQSSH